MCSMSSFCMLFLGIQVSRPLQLQEMSWKQLVSAEDIESVALLRQV